MIRTPNRLLAATLGAMVAVFVLGAAGGSLDSGQRMKVLMRVLTYDHNLETRQDKGAVRIAVLFAPNDKASVAEKDSVEAALGALKALKVKGFALEFTSVPYAEATPLETALGKRRVAALYVCSGLSSAVAGIQKFAAATKTATMSGSEQLTRSGLAFAAVESNGKGQIIVNLKAAKEQGLELDAALLGLATVLR